jgi:hypothetical protein
MPRGWGQLVIMVGGCRGGTWLLDILTLWKADCPWEGGLCGPLWEQRALGKLRKAQHLLLLLKCNCLAPMRPWIQPTGSLPANTYHHQCKCILTCDFLKKILFFSEDLVCSPGWPGTHYVTQADLELTILPQPPECWVYRCVPPYLAFLKTFFFWWYWGLK